MKHFIDLSSLRISDMEEILDISYKVKLDPSLYSDALEHKKIGLYFEKPSMRTRVSFEVGISELGGFPISLQPSEIQMGTRESVADVARVLSRYLDAVMMRVDRHSDLTEFAEYSDISVINGLSDFSHPCQAMADMLTIQEYKKGKSCRIVYIGDGNNVCNSLIKASSILGYEMRVSCPRGYEPAISPKEVPYSVIYDPLVAVEGADVIYTDVWTSMGQEAEVFVRRKVFEKYRVSMKLLMEASSNCIFMHCLPAHRGEEVDAEVIDGPNSVVFDQAENRLHAQKGILIWLLK
ncbi:MAG TPA: ornithine carbamoyltransferase [Oligoflexia bacterium]|nr:ornithine carbamoyltransferase [Oligoflexia bacterium]HMP48629.1 ornithine carbamoyltransferase [Oligoflexia bacterium]